jgi:hypothetical protein
MLVRKPAIKTGDTDSSAKMVLKTVRVSVRNALKFLIKFVANRLNIGYIPLERHR